MLLAAGVVHAAQSATLSVTARVAPWVRWSIRAQPESIDVTRDDLARGFIDIDAGVLSVQNNHHAGYLVVFGPLDEWAQSMTVDGLARHVVVAPGGGFTHEPFAGTYAIERTVRCHIVLRSGLSTGTYALPLHIDVRALDVRH